MPLETPCMHEDTLHKGETPILTKERETETDEGLEFKGEEAVSV